MANGGYIRCFVGLRKRIHINGDYKNIKNDYSITGCMLFFIQSVINLFFGYLSLITQLFSYD